MKETLDSIRVNFDLDNLVVMPFIVPEKEQQLAEENPITLPQKDIYFDVV